MAYNNFVLWKEVWRYVGDCQNFDQTIEDFAALLEDFPEPAYKWIDERLPHEQPGPGTWMLELQNDCEAHYTFNISLLNQEAMWELTSALESLVTDDFQRCYLGDDAYVDRVWKATVEYRELSTSIPLRITYAIYWRVSD